MLKAMELVMDRTERINAQLARNARRATVMDWGAVVAFLSPVIAGLIWVWLSQWTETDGGGLVGLIIVACGACIWLVVIRILYSHITQRFAPSYIIDDSDPTIVRLYGAVRMDGTDGAAQQLLRVRPGLRLGDGDTYAKYGCTLAAVPMTAADQQATDGTEARNSK